MTVEHRNDVRNDVDHAYFFFTFTFAARWYEAFSDESNLCPQNRLFEAYVLRTPGEWNDAPHDTKIMKAVTENDCVWCTVIDETSAHHADVLVVSFVERTEP